MIKFIAAFSWKQFPQLLLHRNLSNLSSINLDPNLLFDQVKGYPVHPKSTNSHSLRASLNSVTMLTCFSLPPIFSFKLKTSLKSPKQSHGKEDNVANLFSNFHMCYFELIQDGQKCQYISNNSHFHYELQHPLGEDYTILSLL